MEKRAGLFAGLDIGGTKTAALITDQNDCALGQAVQPTDTANPAALLASIRRTIEAALIQAKALAHQIISIGVGVPGHVDPATGTVQLAVNLNLEAFPLGAAVADQFGAPTLLENDVRTAAIGAFHYLAQKEAIQHMAYLSIGTGVAAGVVLNGRLFRGQHGMAGEIGHMTVDPNGDLCNCGLRGCLETVVSGPAIIRQMLAANSELDQTIKSAGDVYRAAAAGHPAALNIVQLVSRHLCRAIQWLILTYDVEKIVLGGGVSRSGPSFLRPIWQEMASLRQQSSLARALLLDQKIVPIPANYSPGLWGAVHLARLAVTQNAK